MECEKEGVSLTSRRTWKKRESSVARDLGTMRTPLSGSMSAHTSSDTLSDTFYVESKLRANPPGWSLFEDVCAKAKKEGKVPMIVFSKKFKQRKMAVVDYDWLISIIREKYNIS